MSTENTATESTMGRPKVPTATLAWDIHRVANVVGHAPTMDEYRTHGNYGTTPICKRFDGWVNALRAANLSPRPEQYAHVSERFGFDVIIGARRAYRERGRPPTRREVGIARRLGETVKSTGRLDNLLRAAGVPGRADVVAEAVADRLADRYPWQDFIELQAPDLKESTGMDSSSIGNILCEIADGERSPDAADQFVLDDLQRSRRTTWQVREAELVTDGGTTPADAETVAWCPGCKRYIKSENEASHVRRKHLRSYPGEIQSRYRRVSKEHLPASALNALSNGASESDDSDYRITEVLE